MASELSFRRHPTNSLESLLVPLRDHLRNAWTEDPDFLAKFFPVNDHIRDTFTKSKKGLYHRKRWAGIPSNPVAASRLYTPLNRLINNLLDRFSLLDDHKGNRRLSLNTSKGVEPRLKYRIRPSLLIAGSGKHFLTSEESSPYKHYGAGISPIVIRLESQDETFYRDCLSVGVQEVLAYQQNRRYVFGVVISQQTLEVYMFDHSGVTSSPPLDYHLEPEQFCAIIAGLASHDVQRLGFDTSMFKDGRHWGLLTREVFGRNSVREVKYTVFTTLHYMAYIIGRGTVCFAAANIEERKQYVIKDSWVSMDELEGKESEASLLTHARGCGVSKGIPLLRHSEEVHVKGESGHLRPDTVLNNRHATLTNTSKLERLHTRLVLAPYGRPLEKFSNRKELLFAYHDALQAHHNIYSVAGILHRDIKPGNIVINPGGEEGNRGVLIDYDHAIRVADTSPYSTKRKIGTHLFMSRKALKGIDPQTYLDDLESFYYTLLYIVLLWPKQSRGLDLPSPFNLWVKETAFSTKNGFLFEEFIYKTDPRFGKPLETLVIRLHSVFRKMMVQAFLAEFRDESPPVVNHDEVYNTMLSHVRDAIEDLDRETQDGFATPCNMDHEEREVPAAFSSSEISSISTRKNIVMTLAANRVRRSKANLRLAGAVRVCEAPSLRHKIKRK